jgi:hypothetical protein
MIYFHMAFTMMDTIAKIHNPDVPLLCSIDDGQENTMALQYLQRCSLWL